MHFGWHGSVGQVRRMMKDQMVVEAGAGADVIMPKI